MREAAERELAKWPEGQHVRRAPEHADDHARRDPARGLRRLGPAAPRAAARAARRAAGHDDLHLPADPGAVRAHCGRSSACRRWRATSTRCCCRRSPSAAGHPARTSARCSSRRASRTAPAWSDVEIRDQLMTLLRRRPRDDRHRPGVDARPAHPPPGHARRGPHRRRDVPARGRRRVPAPAPGRPARRPPARRRPRGRRPHAPRGHRRHAVDVARPHPPRRVSRALRVQARALPRQAARRPTPGSRSAAACGAASARRSRSSRCGSCSKRCSPASTSAPPAAGPRRSPGATSRSPHATAPASIASPNLKRARPLRFGRNRVSAHEHTGRWCVRPCWPSPCFSRHPPPPTPRARAWPRCRSRCARTPSTRAPSTASPGRPRRPAIRRFQAAKGLTADGIVGPPDPARAGHARTPSGRLAPAATRPPGLGRRRAAVRARDARLPARVGRRRLRRPHQVGRDAPADLRRPPRRRRGRARDPARPLRPAGRGADPAQADQRPDRRPLRPARQQLPRGHRLPRRHRHPDHRRRVRPRLLRRATTTAGA